MLSLRQLSYDFFSLVTAAASGSHWGYKGLNGKVYIFISTSLTSKQQHRFIRFSYNFNTKNCLQAWMECTYYTFIDILYLA